eukprot:Partr_v1_DN25869_c1_g1_i2_m2682 putative Histone acetyltransferase
MSSVKVPPESCRMCMQSACAADPDPLTARKLLECIRCSVKCHPKCVYEKIIPDNILATEWECCNCKTCSTCSRAKPDDPELLLCDYCDSGYHCYCLDPPMQPDQMPDSWACDTCVRIASVGLAKGSKKESSLKKRRKILTLRTSGSVSSTASEDHVDDEEDYENSKRHPPDVSAADRESFDFFNGRLSYAESSIQQYLPGENDVAMFEQSKRDAQKISQRPQSISVGTTSSLEEMIPRIKHMIIGKFKIDTWFLAPYPEEYNLLEDLYVCEFCLKYIKYEETMKMHAKKCTLRAPPGDEIYRDGNISIFEVDGRKNKIYCQNLCLMAKMFLDHKTLYYDVEPFLFYVLTEVDESGCHFVGYFSKEKRSSNDYNLSCIITLPCYQGNGYGQFLIDFSYLLSRKEEKTGSPEKPLSDLGLLTYRSYWRSVVTRFLLKCLHSASKNIENGNVPRLTIDSISQSTGMTVDDVVTTLQDLDFLKKDADSGDYVISVDVEKSIELLKKYQKKNRIIASADCLRWTPFVLTRMGK